MSKFNKLYNNSNKTILGVGAVSFNCIDAAIEIANDYKIPIILIASRRQIECKEMGGGYVTDTETFTKYVREKDKGNYIFIERDHGSLWQGNNEENLDYFIAFDYAKKSYEEDIKNGFDILHIDPSLKKRQLEFIIKDIKELYHFCHTAACFYEKDVIFEVGTEECNGQISDIYNFKYFIDKIQDLKLVKFIVGNTGTLVKEIQNVGRFNEKQAAKLVEICNENNLMLREHNLDYSNEKILSVHPEIGIHSANVAPEFGVIETSKLLHCLKSIKMNKEIKKFIKTAYLSKKWEKWMEKDEQSETSMEYKSLICGHYIFNHPEILKIKEQAKQKCDIGSILKNEIKNSILKYLVNFNWVKNCDTIKD